MWVHKIRDHICKSHRNNLNLHILVYNLTSSSRLIRSAFLGLSSKKRFSSFQDWNPLSPPTIPHNVSPLRFHPKATMYFNIYIYIYVCVCVCVCMCMYMFIYSTSSIVHILSSSNTTSSRLTSILSPRSKEEERFSANPDRFGLESIELFKSSDSLSYLIIF